MGIFKDTKAGALGNAARKAREDGRGTFAAMLNSPMTQADLSSEIEDWSVMIDAVQAEGWALAHWTVGQDRKGRPQAYPVFRRVG